MCEGTHPVLAAEYLRTSTGEQPHSMVAQRKCIREYAAANGYAVVRTYCDDGRSGLTLKNRPGLSALLEDITSGFAEYSVVLVYDVSRWGRFQDGDESAHYEFICKAFGVIVHYCSESFTNDDSLSSFIIKSLKRTIAGEYSRELSAKCFRGQKRLAQSGFRVGGTSGYGFRRMAVSADHQRSQLLDRGELKSISKDRVVLVPGPAEEVEGVRTIFELAVGHHGGYQAIANELNRRRITYIEGRPWKGYAVEHILKNKKYCGYNIWNCTSRRLGTSWRWNPPEAWVSVPGAFSSIVDVSTFEKAQICMPRQKRWERTELNTWAQQLSENPGTVPCGGPSLNTLRRRLTGLSCLRSHRGTHLTTARDGMLLVRQKKDIVRNHVFDALLKSFPNNLTEVHLPRKSRTLLKLLPAGHRISIMICSDVPRATGILRWRFEAVAHETSFVTMVCLIHPDRFEYYLVPKVDITRPCYIGMNHRLFQHAVPVQRLGQFYDLAMKLCTATSS